MFFGAPASSGSNSRKTAPEDSRGKLRWCPGRSCSAAAGEPGQGRQEAGRTGGVLASWGGKMVSCEWIFWIFYGFSDFLWILVDLNGIFMGVDGL